MGDLLRGTTEQIEMEHPELAAQCRFEPDGPTSSSAGTTVSWVCTCGAQGTGEQRSYDSSSADDVQAAYDTAYLRWREHKRAHQEQKWAQSSKGLTT